MHHAQTFKPPGVDVAAAVRRFLFDTVVFDAGVLRALVDFAGADRVLLGSDYPFDMGDARPAEIVRALGLPPEDEAQILGGNYERLVGACAETFDVVVAGGGHNALIAAAYLAKAGNEVCVLDARHVLGGDTATEELTLPGFRHDTCSTAHNLIQANPALRELRARATTGSSTSSRTRSCTSRSPTARG